MFLAQIRCQSTYEQRYNEKIKQRLQELGMKDVSEYKEKMKTVLQEAVAEAKPAQNFPGKPNSPATKPANHKRSDGSPIVPLGDIMDLTRILETPHTAEQISALWTAYHTKKSLEGRGLLSAVIPRATYEAFLPNARKYPSFILPLPRPEAQLEPPKDGAASNVPVEFYFMEWAQYPAPHPPSLDAEALFKSSKSQSKSPNPPCTTVIFTPLQEYKLKQAYALPHLVLTHYTDLAHSHDLVLMRGELTPSQSDAGRSMLSPSVAQILAFGLQQFYLPGQNAQKAKLLQTFHEKPEEFSWEELISTSPI